MFPRKVVFTFLCRLAIAYGLLVTPWPGWKDGWASVLRAAASQVLAGSSGSREVSFEALKQPGNPADTRIVIVNRDLMQADGSGLVRNLDTNVEQFEMRAIVLLAALIFATPISWRRRGWASLVGLFFLHGSLLCILSFCIWRESAEVLLVDLSPRMKMLTGIVQQALTGQSHMVLPILIWIFSVFPWKTSASDSPR